VACDKCNGSLHRRARRVSTACANICGRAGQLEDTHHHATKSLSAASSLPAKLRAPMHVKTWPACDSLPAAAAKHRSTAYCSHHNDRVCKADKGLLNPSCLPTAWQRTCTEQCHTWHSLKETACYDPVDCTREQRPAERQPVHDHSAVAHTQAKPDFLPNR
jgi:hypothetical protein